MVVETMATALLACLPDRPRAIGGSPEELDAYLEARFTEARAAWQGVKVDRLELARWLGARIPEAGSLLEALVTLSAADLYLACACAGGDPTALAAFQEAHGVVIERALRRLRLGEADRQDVTQSVWERLFVGKTISQYGGRGKLASWVRATAVHAGLNALEKTRPASEDDDVLAALPAEVPDPELQTLKLEHRAAFEEAVSEAVKALSAQERTLLLQHHADGLTLDQLAVLYGVDRRTISRRLAATRQALVEQTEAAVLHRLEVDPMELSSLKRLVRSQLRVSLFRLLRQK